MLAENHRDVWTSTISAIHPRPFRSNRTTPSLDAQASCCGSGPRMGPGAVSFTARRVRADS